MVTPAAHREAAAYLRSTYEMSERRACRVLGRMEAWLLASPYLVNGALSCADISLVAYTRMAADGGFDLAGFPAVKAWVERVDRALGLEPYP